MKFLGIPIIYIVIAVGVLGIVTYSYVSYNKPAFVADDTLKCQREYDFSQVQFTREAKQDWDKCYMPQPLYERRQDGQISCRSYPEDSCTMCAATLAIKYNDVRYCEIMQPCVFFQDKFTNITRLINNCKSLVRREYFEDLCIFQGKQEYANTSLILSNADMIYAAKDRINLLTNLRNKYCS